MTNNNPAFYHVSNIERPLSSIRNYAAGLAMISETMGEEGLVVQEMSWAITDLVKKIDKEYSALFKLTHPDRERFEREGWPEGRQPPEKSE
jgi:hypothetical protein